MSINNIANSVFPNTLSGLETLNVTDITINGIDVTSLFVPYTGANTNVDLNNKNLASVANVGTTTVVATGAIQGGALTTTGLTTTNTLKINSLPAGTQVNLLAYDATGNVIQGTVTTPVPSQFNITTTTGLGQYYIPLISTLSGATPIYGDQTGTIYYNNNTQKLTVGNIQLLALGSGTQAGILAYDSAYNVIQGSVPVPTQLLTTAITSGTSYFLPMVNSGSTGNQSYFSTGSFSYNYPTDTFLVTGTLQIGSNLILQGGTATTFSSLPSLLTPTFALGVNSNNQLVRFNLTNQIGLTAVSTNNDYNLIFTSSNTTTSNATLNIDDGLNITYNPSTDLLSVSNISVTGTIGGPNTMTLLQGGTQLMTLSTMNIFAQSPLISGYGGAGQPPQFAFNQNGGTGSRFLLKGSGTALYPVGFGIDTGDEMWISNRNAGFKFYSNGTNTVQISTTGQLTLTNSMILGTLGTNQSIRLGWGNLPAMQATAFFNLAIGRNNGTSLTTGYNNLMIGEGCLPNITTGDNVIAIGQSAGTSVTTGGDSIFIGTGANGLGASARNQVVIGANSIGMGANTVTVGNYDTTGFFVAGDVDNFFKARKTEVGAKLGSMFDFSVAGTWNDSNSLFVTTGGLGGTNNGVGMGYNTTLGTGLLVSIQPNVAWRPMRYKAEQHQFFVNGNVSQAGVNQYGLYAENAGYFTNYTGAINAGLGGVGSGDLVFYANSSGVHRFFSGGTQALVIAPASGTGLCFGTSGVGLQTITGSPYGNVSTYGNGPNTYNGYDINRRWCLMGQNANVEAGFHDNTYSWIWRTTANNIIFDRPSVVYNALPQQTYVPNQILIGANGNNLQWGVLYSTYYMNPTIAWGGSTGVADFYKASATSIVRVSGAASYWVPSGGMYYTRIIIINLVTGTLFDYYLYQFTNIAGNHVSYPIMLQTSSGIPVGTYRVLMSTNAITDGNDHLYILTEIAPS